MLFKVALFRGVTIAKRTGKMRYAIFLFIVAMANSDEYSRTSLGDRIDKASVKMLKEAYLVSEDSNVITSPLGVLLLLSLYSSGTTDESRNEIMSLLGSSDYKELTESYTSLSNDLASIDSSNFTLANKIYVSKKLTLEDEFLNAVRSYKSEVDTIDFTDISAAADIINQWAAEKTKDQIMNPVSEGLLDPNAVAILINVIFFQGHWHVPFKAEETEDMDFHVDKSITVKKPLMHLEEPLFYYEDQEIGARLIELPYQESGFRMVVVLPDEIDGLDLVLDKVAERGLLDDVFALSPTTVPINLYMPKFDITSKLDFKSILPKLGVKEIFRKFPGAPGVVKGRNVTVSEFFQEAIVKVDEEGATAGAFTGQVMVEASSVVILPEPLDFIVDHPFLFAILHKDVVLFTGTYSQ